MRKRLVNAAQAGKYRGKYAGKFFLRCQALSGAVRHKKTAHGSAAHIGSKKAALGGLIDFYKVK